MSENLKLGMESLWYGINLWISCLVFLLPLRRKTHFKVRLILSGAVCVLILSGVYYLIENLTDWSYWGQVPLLFITYFSAVLIFYNCVKGKGFGLWYCGVWGTITFLLVLETSYVLCSPLLGDLGNWLLKILFSVAVNVAIGLTLARWMPEKGQYSDWPETDGFCMGVLYYVRKFVYLRKGRSGGCFIQHCVAVLLYHLIVSAKCIV